MVISATRVPTVSLLRTTTRERHQLQQFRSCCAHIVVGRDDIKLKLKEVLEEHGVLGAKSPVRELAFSKVSSKAATSLCALLDISLEDGNMMAPLPDGPFLSCGVFDMGNYANEDSALPHFLAHIEAGLKLNGVSFNRGGFTMYDLHKERLFTITSGSTCFSGGLDAGIVPFGLSKCGCTRQLRAGIEVKHSDKHKATYKQRYHGIPPTGAEQDVLFTGSVLGQALVELLAAFTFAQVPSMALLLSSYDTNVFLELSDGVCRHWAGLSFDAAMFKMGEYLKGCDTDRRYTLDKHRSELPAETVENIERLRKRLKGESLLEEQLNSLAGEFDDDPRERLRTTLELIDTHHAWSSMYV
ncbi:hypothetical protein VOLCADRAFT_92455 [Volvox carteri f. nagariensis]|uniref:Uncharacterized protein n=1 Tax=Volvox carteri f. nagariensis TaxID=3068 RepID=D8TZQ0_VOLCA|nr:uncharacterized protein VOLCADRAFT_92455 [Volvox carteri f. nagariensis]EFJ46963.1 hypothetical protein VOLCADRAFT_92455 [Volvox carteri f. nagariensis]|eukprot:XP_002951858.1 hypothetical protein VOLCADRAFT_92455 [Volvox carteri f. nagariensis]